MTDRALETRAWRGIGFAYPDRIPTMLSAEERQYLYWLGRRAWSGRGCVVEIGPWLGGSTACLAAGMRDSGHDARGALVVVDNFLWREFMAARADLPLRPGDSFLAHFRAHTADYRELIDCRTCALPDEPIAGDREAERKRFAAGEPVPLFDGALDRPAEIVFVDGAKSWRGMRHLLRVLAGSFVPGQTLLVCQDFKYWGAYWVPALMARLLDHLEPVHLVHGGTTLSFRLERPIPTSLLDGLEDHVAQLPTSSTLAAIDRACTLLADAGDGAGARAVGLARVSFLAHQGRLTEAVSAFRASERSWPTWAPSDQLERARAYLRDEKGVALAQPVRAARGSLRQQAISGVGWATLATLGRNGIGAAVTVLLARLLVPEDFGLLAMALVFVQFVGLVPQLGLGPALVQARSLDERQLSSVFWLGSSVAALLALAIAACAPAIAQFYGDPRLVPLTLWLAAGIVIESLSAVPVALLERNLAFHRLAFVEVAAGAVGGAAGVACALGGLGAQSLAVQMLASSVCVAAGSCLAVRWRPRARFELASIRALLRFGTGLTGFQLLNYWIRNADNLLLGRFAGSVALGYYATAYRLMLLPLTHVTRIFQRVMFPVLARIQSDPARVKARYLQANRLIGLVTIPAVCGLLVVADPFVRLLLGERWAPVVPLLQILCLVGLQQPLVSTTGWIYQSQGRTDLMLIWALVSGLVTVGGFVAGLRWGATGVALSYVATRYLLWVPAIRVPGRLIGLGFGEFARNLAGIYGCAAAMAAIVFAAGRPLPPDWPHAARLAVQVSVGVASFALLAAAFRLAAWCEARALLEEQWRRRRVSQRRQGAALA